jgi:alkanesulfonate monooxygenase SsuD/methylene tetrahydromethanopterin reductase-like flavin-dependent oxidoreductase (luciferase family)
MILKALETGVIEGDGKHYKQPRAFIRPKPSRTFKGRVTQVAMSPDSALEAATHGAQIMVFTQKPIEQHNQDFGPYRARFLELHGRQAPPPMMAGVMVCHEDATRAADLARKHIAGYLVTAMHHYELMGEHFKKAKGYESYGEAVDMLRDMGLEAFSEAYMNAQAWGTPRQILEKLEHWRRVVGDFDMIVAVRAAGIPYADAERSLRLFAQKVMPEFRQWAGAQTAA